MLARYRKRVARLGPGARAALAEELELTLSPRRSLDRIVEAAGLCTADVVLVLLRRGMREEAEEVAGVPAGQLRFEPARIAGRPARLLLDDDAAPAAVATRAATWGEERLVWINPDNPRVPGTEASTRYSGARLGMTRAQLVNKGVSRREQREWERRGWADFR